MPTPDWVREAARKRRERVCLVCRKAFIAKSAHSKGLCSRLCQDAHFSAVTKGRKHTPETKAKMSASGKAWRISNPEWEERRRIAAVQACQTDEYISGALDRYRRMQDTGMGICSDEVKVRNANAAKWVMKKARAAMEAETDFIALWTDTLERLRRETPYDGPSDCSDYFDYQRRIGKAMLSDPALREIQDSFMKHAIPRFYAEWRNLTEPTP